MYLPLSVIRFWIQYMLVQETTICSCLVVWMVDSQGLKICRKPITRSSNQLNLYFSCFFEQNPLKQFTVSLVHYGSFLKHLVVGSWVVLECIAVHIVNKDSLLQYCLKYTLMYCRLIICGFMFWVRCWSDYKKKKKNEMLTYAFCMEAVGDNF